MVQAQPEQNVREYRTLCLPYPRLTESSFLSGNAEISVFTDEALYEACGTRIAFSTRRGGLSHGAYGQLNLGLEYGDDRATVEENRRILCDALGAGYAFDLLVSPRQVHGCAFIEVGDNKTARSSAKKEADGVICTTPNIPALLISADCVLVTLVAPTGNFALIHSGWRGSIASIAGVGLEHLVKATDCLASEINCYIGPHIEACCYEVDSELLKGFVSEYGSACDAGDSHLDLASAVTCSLVRAGADRKRIAKTGYCTSCHNDMFFSYRAQGGTCGRHGAFAFWRV